MCNCNFLPSVSDARYIDNCINMMDMGSHTQSPAKRLFELSNVCVFINNYKFLKCESILTG